MRSSTKSACLAAFTVAALGAAPGLAQRDAQESLEAVRREIGTLEQRISRQSAARDRASAALRQAELDIAATAADLERIEASAREQERLAAALADDRAAAERRLAGERAALAEQIRLAYINGRQEALKLLLSQETPATFGRMLVYYEYFNQARSARIGAVAEDLEKLSRLSVEAAGVSAEQAALRGAEAEKLAALHDARKRREALLAELETSIDAAGTEVERLRAEEQRLTTLVTELAEALEGFPDNAEEPFPSLKGRLPWPVSGDVAAAFGRPRSGGGVRWNGVLLKSDRGAPVRAVHHGRVAFADWLAGLGLLLILDHGDGYMTLYGHNDVLLKEVGDWVAPGEPIGRVGDTGGRSEPSLYFEIRHDGKPLDPAGWIAR